jgi:hypothetical protein
MISAMENLPDNIDELKEIIREITTQSQSEIEFLKEQISLLKAKMFGRRTEKYDLEQFIPGQSFLPSLESDNWIAVTEPEMVVVEKHTRKKTGRKPGMNLSLDHHRTTAKVLSCLFSLFGIKDGKPPGNLHPIIPQERLCLVFMNFHNTSLQLPYND